MGPSHSARTGSLEDFVNAAIVNQVVVRKSGGTCDYYIDGRRLVLDPHCLSLCAERFIEHAQALKVTHVGGEVASALPLVGAIVARSSASDRPLGGFFIREKVKPHGISSLVEGQLPSSAQLLLVDDVIGTGSVAMRCASLLQSLNHTVVAFGAIVDRNEGAANRLAAIGVPLVALHEMERASAES